MRNCQIKGYNTWQGLRSRCNNKRDKEYRNYGGRGIKVCERWSSFENFLEDMGEMPEGLSIDRIDNDGDYEPSNCRWANMKVQSNNRRNNRLITHNGETLSCVEWSERIGGDKSLVKKRLALGWSEERAVTTDRWGYYQEPKRGREIKAEEL